MKKKQENNKQRFELSSKIVFDNKDENYVDVFVEEHYKIPPEFGEKTSGQIQTRKIGYIVLENDEAKLDMFEDLEDDIVKKWNEEGINGYLYAPDMEFDSIEEFQTYYDYTEINLMIKKLKNDERLIKTKRRFFFDNKVENYIDVFVEEYVEYITKSGVSSMGTTIPRKIGYIILDENRAELEDFEYLKDVIVKIWNQIGVEGLSYTEIREAKPMKRINRDCNGVYEWQNFEEEVPYVTIFISPEDLVADAGDYYAIIGNICSTDGTYEEEEESLIDDVIIEVKKTEYHKILKNWFQSRCKKPDYNHMLIVEKENLEELGIENTYHVIEPNNGSRIYRTFRANKLKIVSFKGR